MIYWIFLPIILFFICLAVAASGVGGFSLDKSFKLSDLSPLAASTFVAFVVQYLYDRQNKATTLEKQLLSAHITDLIASAVELRSSLAGHLGLTLTEADAGLIVEGFETLSDGISTLKDNLERSHCHKLATQCDSLSSDFVLYKSVITGGNFPKAVISAKEFPRSAVWRHQIERKLRQLSFSVVQES